MSMPVPLNPARLTPAASLNRVRIADLPGLDWRLRGRMAYDLLSTEAVAAEIRRHADQLGLADADQLRATELPRRLARCLVAAEPIIRATADEITRHMGRSLGALLVTLKRGDAASRQARDDWDDSYWTHWQSIRSVWLGGGLASGKLGERLVFYARDALVRQGVDCALQLACYPSLLPLIGAARSVAGDDRPVLVCDFGQSYLKRACAGYEHNRLATLHTLPHVPITWPLPQAETSDPEERSLRLAERMADSMVAAIDECHAHGLNLAPRLAVSIASYVKDGAPMPLQGGAYAGLHTVDPNLEQWLAARVSELAGRSFSIMLLHDGTGAARAYAEAPAAAVITLGTALGIGFCCGTGLPRPLAPVLTITPLIAAPTPAP